MNKIKNAKQREYRKRTHNTSTHKYEKTVNGFLMRKYRNMTSRVNGIQKKKAHLYKGLDILGRQDFYKWAKASPEFWRLFKVWELSGYERKLCPTVNRIKVGEGYNLDNIEWLSHSENSRLGAISARSQVKI